MAELRYRAFGETRYNGTPSGTPTDYRFTGQRQDSGLGLYHMGARWYDPYLGRWLSPDSIVPDPANPQSLNRYSYTRNNPVKYRDPTGHYSEDEIMTAFEASTWDEVLDLFRPEGALEGLWGWLEMLRKASDGDLAMFGALEGSGINEVSLGALPGNMGRFSRDNLGHILVGGKAANEFAEAGRGYIYSLLKEKTTGVYSLGYRTLPTQLHFHGRVVKGEGDWSAAWNDAIGITIDAVGLFAIANVEIAPASTAIGGALLGLGFAFDLGAATEGFLNVFVAPPVTGRFDSGHILDMVGLIPALGVATDLVSVASNVSGWQLEFTP